MNNKELLYSFIEALYEDHNIYNSSDWKQGGRKTSIKELQEFASDWLNEIQTEKEYNKNYDNFESCKGYEE